MGQEPLSNQNLFSSNLFTGLMDFSSNPSQTLALPSELSTNDSTPFSPDLRTVDFPHLAEKAALEIKNGNIDAARHTYEQYLKLASDQDNPIQIKNAQALLLLLDGKEKAALVLLKENSPKSNLARELYDSLQANEKEKANFLAINFAHTLFQIYQDQTAVSASENIVKEFERQLFETGDFQTAFNQLSPHDQELLTQAVGGNDNLKSLCKLSLMSSATERNEFILSWSRKHSNPHVAASLLASLTNKNPQRIDAIDINLSRRAEVQLAQLNGLNTGNFSDTLHHEVKTFMEKAFDPYTILSFTVAGLVNRMSRYRSLTRLSKAPANFWTRGFVANARITTRAFAAETFAFTLMGMAPEAFHGRGLNLQNFSQQLTLNTITLASLKVSSASMGKGFDILHGIKPGQVLAPRLAFQKSLLSQGASIQGLFLGHKLQADLDLRAHMSTQDNLRQAVATHFQMMAGNKIAHVATPASIKANQARMERETRIYERVIENPYVSEAFQKAGFDLNRLFPQLNPALANASLAASVHDKSIDPFNIMMMEAVEEGGAKHLNLKTPARLSEPIRLTDQEITHHPRKANLLVRGGVGMLKGLYWLTGWARNHRTNLRTHHRLPIAELAPSGRNIYEAQEAAILRGAGADTLAWFRWSMHQLEHAPTARRGFLQSLRLEMAHHQKTLDELAPLWNRLDHISLAEISRAVEQFHATAIDLLGEKEASRAELIAELGSYFKAHDHLRREGILSVESLRSLGYEPMALEGAKSQAYTFLPDQLRVIIENHPELSQVAEAQALVKAARQYYEVDFPQYFLQFTRVNAEIRQAEKDLDRLRAKALKNPMDVGSAYDRQISDAEARIANAKKRREEQVKPEFQEVLDTYQDALNRFLDLDPVLAQKFLIEVSLYESASRSIDNIDNPLLYKVLSQTDALPENLRPLAREVLAAKANLDLLEADAHPLKNMLSGLSKLFGVQSARNLALGRLEKALNHLKREGQFEIAQLLIQAETETVSHIEISHLIQIRDARNQVFAERYKVSAEYRKRFEDMRVEIERFNESNLVSEAQLAIADYAFQRARLMDIYEILKPFVPSDLQREFNSIIERFDKACSNFEQIEKSRIDSQEIVNVNYNRALEAPIEIVFGEAFPRLQEWAADLMEQRNPEAITAYRQVNGILDANFLISPRFQIYALGQERSGKYRSIAHAVRKVGWPIIWKVGGLVRSQNKGTANGVEDQMFMSFGAKMARAGLGNQTHHVDALESTAHHYFRSNIWGKHDTWFDFLGHMINSGAAREGDLASSDSAPVIMAKADLASKVYNMFPPLADAIAELTIPVGYTRPEYQQGAEVQGAHTMVFGNMKGGRLRARNSAFFPEMTMPVANGAMLVFGPYATSNNILWGSGRGFRMLDGALAISGKDQNFTLEVYNGAFRLFPRSSKKIFRGDTHIAGRTIPRSAIPEGMESGIKRMLWFKLALEPEYNAYVHQDSQKTLSTFRKGENAKIEALAAEIFEGELGVLASHDQIKALRQRKETAWAEIRDSNNLNPERLEALKAEYQRLAALEEKTSMERLEFDLNQLSLKADQAGILTDYPEIKAQLKARRTVLEQAKKTLAKGRRIGPGDQITLANMMNSFDSDYTGPHRDAWVEISILKLNGIDDLRLNQENFVKESAQRDALRRQLNTWYSASEHLAWKSPNSPASRSQLGALGTIGRFYLAADAFLAPIAIVYGLGSFINQKVADLRGVPAQPLPDFFAFGMKHATRFITAATGYQPVMDLASARNFEEIHVKASKEGRPVNWGSNHLGFFDILLQASLIGNARFVAKKELVIPNKNPLTWVQAALLHPLLPILTLGGQPLIKRPSFPKKLLSVYQKLAKQKGADHPETIAAKAKFEKAKARFEKDQEKARQILSDGAETVLYARRASMMTYISGTRGRVLGPGKSGVARINWDLRKLGKDNDELPIEGLITLLGSDYVMPTQFWPLWKVSTGKNQPVRVKVDFHQPQVDTTKTEETEVARLTQDYQDILLKNSIAEMKEVRAHARMGETGYQMLWSYLQRQLESGVKLIREGKLDEAEAWCKRKPVTDFEFLKEVASTFPEIGIITQP